MVYRMNNTSTLRILAVLSFSFALNAQHVPADRLPHSKFRQLEEELPTPNSYRNAAGAPGHAYYQNRADYDIQLSLDEKTHVLTGSEWITYRNNSPDALPYIWVQLDQNMMKPGSMTDLSKKGSIPSSITPEQISEQYVDKYQGGFNVTEVKSATGAKLPYVINNTMMRVDLPTVLAPGQSVKFYIAWSYLVNDRMKVGGRSGYEHFDEEGNTLYTIAQFFPRMAVYGDNVGWQHKQFLGQGEFTLPFGDYKVAITVPSDHLVAATGTLTNESSVLTAVQRQRLAEARKATDKPVIIATEAEAREREKTKATSTKTWVFTAKNVRDFAFATSRKFIWDAMAVKVGNRTTLAESFYPKEGNPLWEQFSTRAVAQTIETYSKFTVDYPYERAISVHTEDIGMEYPMICFNGGRPDADGTYSEATKLGMISVIIHEVGHNFFPMIINSDERQWTWMDEGLNTFVQYLAEQEWDVNYPSRRGPAYKIVEYMRSPALNQVPIMTNSESVIQFGNNAYGKPATALNILRETVMGRELFDHAFKTYCTRWAFKHPSPADFFRSMEDASGVDLDWFWRGWFYTTEAVDQELSKVRIAAVPTLDPKELEAQRKTEADTEYKSFIGNQRNELSNRPTKVDKDPAYRDFYVTEYNRHAVSKADAKRLAGLKPGPQGYLHEVTVKNVGGLIMPVVVRYTFADGTSHVERWPAEIWIQSEQEFTKTVFLPKKAVSIELDPFKELADIDLYNNSWGGDVEVHLEALPKPTGAQQWRSNPMREARN
ncbi:MAG: M1 family metallopeptidase [Cryomorphaceae bacterium]|nr:M1 family metallopeptidase [Cryomorphaceae bacterium]